MPTGSRPPWRRRQRRRRRIVGGVVVIAAMVVVAVTVTSTGSRTEPSAIASSDSVGGSAVAGNSADGTAVDRTAFSATACRRFAPTSGNRHLTVFLDAGHGGLDPGSVGVTESGKTIDEAKLTLPVELDTMRILRREGFTVVVSRTRNTPVAKLTAADVSDHELTVQGVHANVAARAVCANDAHANILIGIYFDAGEADNAGSVTGYDAVRTFAAKNLRLATLVQKDVLHAMNAQAWKIPNEGVLKDSELGSEVSSRSVSYGHLLLLGPASPGWFDTPSQMPGALIEPLFITDPFEGSIAASAKGQHVIAEGLASAVKQYFAPAASQDRSR